MIAPPNVRIGVYVCHCGNNIAGRIDVAELSAWVGDHFEDVVVARDYRFLCSTPGQQLIREDIEKHGVNRVVVAACSPHLHEKTFREVCRAAELNPYLLEITNIREQCAWVHVDPEGALAKAKSLISAAVRRVRYHEPLETEEVPVNEATLVVGGGIAGLQAALDLADAGHPVYLVERRPSIGGHMAQFDKTFPTLDCAACILTPRMSAVGEHDKITLLTYSEVEEVQGSIGNFRVTVRKKARYVNEEDCTGCGVCQTKCPRNVRDDDFEAGLANRKAIYLPFPQAVPLIPVIDREACIWFERGKCGACAKLCPTGAVDFDQEDQLVELEVGNIILATGWQLFDCRKVPQYGYGQLANVFTSLEFERMCNAAGPTGGQIVLRDGKTPPHSVAIVHCVGSRDANHNRHCSAVCCMAALKFAHLVRERTDAEVYSFYIDMRAYQKGYEEFYERLQAEGVQFIRGKVAEVIPYSRRRGRQEKLEVVVDDTLLGKIRRIPVDMVVLMGALQPQADAKELGLLCGVGCTDAGFFIERHPKLDPVATMTDGIFVAGTCQGPKDIPATVAQGSAAASQVQSLIGQGHVPMEPIVATIDEQRCSGCRICNELCPYGAIDYDGDDRVSRVTRTLCKGCGTCVSACPAQAIEGAHFNNQQIMAQIEGILWDAGAA